MDFKLQHERFNLEGLKKFIISMDYKTLQMIIKKAVISSELFKIGLFVLVSNFFSGSYFKGGRVRWVDSQVSFL